MLIFDIIKQILIHHHYEYSNFYNSRRSVNFMSTIFDLNILFDHVFHTATLRKKFLRCVFGLFFFPVKNPIFLNFLKLFEV